MANAVDQRELLIKLLNSLNRECRTYSLSIQKHTHKHSSVLGVGLLTNSPSKGLIKLPNGLDSTVYK